MCDHACGCGYCGGIATLHSLQWLSRSLKSTFALFVCVTACVRGLGVGARTSQAWSGRPPHCALGEAGSSDRESITRGRCQCIRPEHRHRDPAAAGRGALLCPGPAQLGPSSPSHGRGAGTACYTHVTKQVSTVHVTAWSCLHGSPCRSVGGGRCEVEGPNVCQSPIPTIPPKWLLHDLAAYCATHCDSHKRRTCSVALVVPPYCIPTAIGMKEIQSSTSRDTRLFSQYLGIALHMAPPK